MTQKELKEKYKQFLVEYWQDEKMIKHCLGEVSYIVELSDGSIIPLEKPKLKTSFCFGYGYCGVSDEEDFQDAYRMSNHAKTNEDYFRNENLKDINDKLKAIQKDYVVIYLHNHYISQTNKDLRTYSIFNEWDTKDNNFMLKNLIEPQRLSQEDVSKIIAGLEEVKKLHIKRINTYLKKYGLSKVKSWTYLCD